ncbi:hypothetical protein DL96DRAFT_1822519 [Flagelloscypha sp. PMI_526]|nr:hypothetical protein DL96DRAFT_1822519 [Flagelloscypha sp. PMI_526]
MSQCEYPPVGSFEALAPKFIGYLLNVALCGILIHQVYIYNVAFSKDPWGMKLIVYFVFILELAQTVVQIRDNYKTNVLQYGNPAMFDDGQTGWLSIPVLTSLSSAIVQGFFGFRIRLLSNSWIAAGAVWVLSLTQLGAGLAQGIKSYPLKLHDIVTKTKREVIIWMGTKALADVLIAIVLSYYLTRMRTGMDDTNNIVTRIVRLTVGTGVLTAIAALLVMILYLTSPPWLFLLATSISKIYSNSMMVMFNRRIEIRSKGGSFFHDMASRSEPNTFRVAAGPPSGEMGAVWEMDRRIKPIYPELENRVAV